jgi:hypothetical protein
MQMLLRSWILPSPKIKLLARVRVASPRFRTRLSGVISPSYYAVATSLGTEAPRTR